MLLAEFQIGRESTEFRVRCGPRNQLSCWAPKASDASVGSHVLFLAHIVPEIVRVPHTKPFEGRSCSAAVAQGQD